MRPLRWFHIEINHGQDQALGGTWDATPRKFGGHIATAAARVDVGYRDRFTWGNVGAGERHRCQRRAAQQHDYGK